MGELVYVVMAPSSFIVSFPKWGSIVFTSLATRSFKQIAEAGGSYIVVL